MTYSIGTPGTPWGDAERAAWRALQREQRSYADDVLSVIERLRDRFDAKEYGRIDDGALPLVALATRRWDARLPVWLVTGGVHGYETSGVHGALAFVEQHGAEHEGRANLLVAPCVSPWAYERIQRWNAGAVDPNRSFREASPAPESAALMALLAPYQSRIVMHVDLHETTDTDESEFRPALAARDGKPFEPGTIPDGFYLVADEERPEPAFQEAILQAVETVTHVAEADENGMLIGTKIVQRGVVTYPYRALGLCAGVTGARFVTTTEVYPDSPRTTPAGCVAAQLAAVRSAIAHVLGASVSA